MISKKQSSSKYCKSLTFLTAMLRYTVLGKGYLVLLLFLLLENFFEFHIVEFNTCPRNSWNSVCTLNCWIFHHSALCSYYIALVSCQICRLNFKKTTFYKLLSFKKRNLEILPFVNFDFFLKLSKKLIQHKLSFLIGTFVSSIHIIFSLSSTCLAVFH